MFEPLPEERNPQRNEGRKGLESSTVFAQQTRQLLKSTIFYKLLEFVKFVKLYLAVCNT